VTAAPPRNGGGDGSNRPWADTEVGQLVAKGHGAGDVLEAWRWKILDEAPGLLVVEAHLPDQLRNPQGQLFGGFTPTYVDFVSLYTVHTGDPDRDPTSERSWLTTINMRCDYFEPIVERTFVIRGELVNQRGLTSLVATRFYQGDVMAAHALTTLRALPAVGGD
jgi:acyl-coenzyme A thioesterase PaaI-like protein